MSDCKQQAEAEPARIRGESEAGRVEQLEADLNLLRAKCHACAQLRQQAQAEAKRLRVELEVFSERLGRAETEALAIVNHRRLRESELEHLRAEARHMQSEMDELRASHDAAQSQRAEMKQSLSWRITAPLRRIGSFLTFRKATP